MKIQPQNEPLYYIRSSQRSTNFFHIMLQAYTCFWKDTARVTIRRWYEHSEEENNHFTANDVDVSSRIFKSKFNMEEENTSASVTVKVSK